MFGRGHGLRKSMTYLEPTVIWRLVTNTLALGGYVLWAVNAYAASMPPELIGEWKKGNSNYCTLEISRFRFTGLDDEGWGCDLKSIRRPDPSFKTTWTIEASCSGGESEKRDNKVYFYPGRV